MSARSPSFIAGATDVGRLALLAHHFVGANWKSLSIPRGRSRAFDASVRERQER